MHSTAATVLAAALLTTPAVAGQEALEPARLERLVRQDCGSCHGLTRKGGLGSDLSVKALAGRDIDDLVRVILQGIPGTAMPPWGPIMTDAEARWIAQYLLSAE